MDVVVVGIVIDCLGYVICYYNWFEKFEVMF